MCIYIYKYKYMDMDTDIDPHTGIYLRSNICENHTSSRNRIFVYQMEGHIQKKKFQTK